MKTFNVGLSRDFLNSDGVNSFGEDGVRALDAQTHIVYSYYGEHRDPVGADQLAGYNGVISLTPKYTAETLAGASDLLVIARFGVGYDNVDVAACTANEVALVITPNGVRKPVAYSILTLMLALVHQLPAKSRLVQEGRWNDRTLYPGKRITGKTIGSVGFGNIAKEMFRMTEPFEMRRIAHDPFADPKTAEAMNVELVDLDTLCAQSDFIAINCLLTPETRHLISDRQFGLMKPTAYVINTARGGIIDEQALIRALETDGIAGAGLDVFEEEPFVSASPLKQMSNVIMTPHSLCWTDELYQGIWAECVDSLVSFSRGIATTNVVNKEVLTKPGFLAKWSRIRGE